MQAMPNTFTKQTTRSLDVGNRKPVLQPIAMSQKGKKLLKEESGRGHNFLEAPWLKNNSRSSSDKLVFGVTSKNETEHRKKKKLPGSGWLLGKKQDASVLGNSQGKPHCC